MERPPSPTTPSKETDQPVNSLYTELDEIEDDDYREVIGDEINDSLDTPEESSDGFLELDTPEDEITPEAPVNIEAQKTEAEATLRQTMEARLVLRESQRFDKTVLEYADRGMQKAEAVATKASDARYLMRDRYEQWRIDAHQGKFDRMTRLSKTAPTEFIRRKFAKKARLEAQRLRYAKGIQEQDRLAYTQKLDATTGKPGERSNRRLERAKELQGRINRMIAAEYKFAELGREHRDQRRKELKGEGDPLKREHLRRKLLEDTSTVAKLEAIGKNRMIDRMLAAYGANSTSFDPVARYMGRLEDTLAQDTQDSYSLVG